MTASTAARRPMDVAMFAGAIAGYGIAFDAPSQTLTVTDNSGGCAPTVIDTLTNVEQLHFSDATLDYDSRRRRAPGRRF